jgi:hypothetical protein
MTEIRRLGKRAIGAAALAAEACLESVGVPSPSALLLLGHMRSGSTLLLHLLMTNPEVAALGERGAAYTCRADFARLAIAARLAGAAPFRRLRYVADQVNHDGLTPDASLLQDRRVRILFLLRRPQPSISSILELYRVHYDAPWSVSRAVDYYVGRLRALMKLGQSLPGPTSAALIRYESMTDSPQRTLEALRTFLGLRQGFSLTYATYPFTGKSGDPGPNIGAGRIVRPRPVTLIDSGSCELERAARVYAECASFLERFELRA